MSKQQTGVIVGMHPETPPERLFEFRELLEARFPGVKFALAAGAASVAFTYGQDEGTEEIDFEPVVGRGETL